MDYRRYQPPAPLQQQSMSMPRAARNYGEVEEADEESTSASSLAAKAIRASSAATRDSSLSSAYAHHSLPRPKPPAEASVPAFQSSPSSCRKDNFSYQYTSMDNSKEPKHGFWSTLARKAKSVIEDDPLYQSPGSHGGADNYRPKVSHESQYPKPSDTPENHRKTDNTMLQKGLGAISSSLNFIGGSIGNALEEGLTKVENHTADIIQETRKLQSRKKGTNREQRKHMANDADGSQHLMSTQTPPQMQTSVDIKLKASRDVAMAMAAKTKLLLRELKTLKSDLAFAKERCGQLEEENKILRESMEKGDNAEDDDLVRLQLETLLAEKARLAHENSVYARENCFLREIVEYHQLTMQDVVYIDERREEVSEVYPKLPGGTRQSMTGSVMPMSPSASESSGTPYAI